jgi:hypothetical protein
MGLMAVTQVMVVVLKVIKVSSLNLSLAEVSTVKVVATDNRAKV